MNASWDEITERWAKTDAAEVQRWAVLAGDKNRTDAEEVELRGLIRKLTLLRHPLSEPCRRRTP